MISVPNHKSNEEKVWNYKLLESIQSPRTEAVLINLEQSKSAGVDIKTSVSNVGAKNHFSQLCTKDEINF